MRQCPKFWAGTGKLLNMLVNVSQYILAAYLDVNIPVSDVESSTENNASHSVKAVARPKRTSPDLCISCMFRSAYYRFLPVQTHLDADRSRISNLRPGACTIRRSLAVHSKQDEELYRCKIMLI
jgi:hypothetical protein